MTVPVGFQLAPVSRDLVAAFAAETGLSQPLAEVMVRRGFSAESFTQEIAEPQAPTWQQFLSEKQRQLLSQAVRGRSVLVFGDYDVDGLAATAITVLALEQVATKVRWQLPNRFQGGYGLSATAVQDAFDAGVEVLVAVDCGITAIDEATLAAELGLVMVVVDHHLPGAVLPQAAVIISPMVAPGRPPLCGAGLALMLTEALGLDGHSVLDLAALGTVADQVPLRGANRWIVQQGLRQINVSPRPGIRALLEQARVRRPIDEQDVAFRLAPRLNSLGRMGSPDDGVRLLLAEADDAKTLAQRVEMVNAERREGLAAIEAECEAAVAANPEVGPILISGDGWSPGLIGIVASRLCGRTGRPTVVAAVAEEQVIGSARGPIGSDVRRALGAAEGLLLRYGGHAQAAGFETTRTDLARLWQILRQELSDQTVPALSVDGVLSAATAPLVLTAQDQLKPFGASFEAPCWLSASGQIGGLRQIGDGGRHLAFSVDSLAAIWWGGGEQGPPPQLVDVAGGLENDPFAHRSRLVVAALRPSLWAEATDIWLGADQDGALGSGEDGGVELLAWPHDWQALADQVGSLLLVTADLKTAWANRQVQPQVLPIGPGLAQDRFRQIEAEGWVRAWLGYLPPLKPTGQTLVFLDPPTVPEMRQWRQRGWRQAYAMAGPGKGPLLARQDVVAAWRQRGQPGPWPPIDPLTRVLAAQVLAELGLDGSEDVEQKVDLLSSPTFERFGAERRCVTVGVAADPP
ncbi:MAG: single-stranded-DNA-specific exonuclease RecJ [Sulfobacillus sp.]